MTVKYDQRADALYVRLSDKPVAKTSEIGDGRVADYAQDGTVVGIEFWGVSEGIDLHDVPEEHALRRELEPHLAPLGIRVLA
jgi:uncharacterized protein YuzE